MPLRPPLVTGGLILVAAACTGSNPTAELVPPPVSQPHAVSSLVDGSADGLAIELLLAGDASGTPAWSAEARPVGDAATARAIDEIAVDHVQSTATAGGGGPALVGSSPIRDLAAAAGAPVDRNGNGTNLDETLEAEAERIAAYSGSHSTAAVLAAPFLPWRRRSADLAAPPPASAAEPWMTVDVGDHVVALTDAVDRVRLLALAANRLLAVRSRGTFGLQPYLGATGLGALQQALAAEATMFASLFTDGGPLGPLGEVGSYDPFTAPRWLPAAVDVDFEPGLAAAPAGYRQIDGASELGTVARALDAGLTLLDLADPATPTAVPELFRGHPFRPPPHVAAAPTVTWSRDIRPLLAFRCGQCHLQQTQGGFSFASYAVMLTGGNKTRQLQLQFIVPGNAQASLLHSILVGPPPPFQRMPQGPIPLPAAELAKIDAWIDGGALENPPVPPAPPRPGEDLALVSFANLVALHLDPNSGALAERRERDGPSGHAGAAATGDALCALAHAAARDARLATAGTSPLPTLALAAQFAADHLVANDGAVLDEVTLPGLVAGPLGDLRAQAALAAGLLAAAAHLPSTHGAHAAAARAADHLLTAFVDGNGWFTRTAGGSPGTYDAATLRALLAALRLAEASGIQGALEHRVQLLQRLRQALVFAEWARHGEVLGDGTADTDHDGIPEPAAAGGDFGRLPLLATRIAIDESAPAVPEPLTWSRHVRPLLLQKCADCHMNGTVEGAYNLDTWRSLQLPGESAGQFAMLVPGSPDDSFFFRKVARRQPGLGLQMPYLRTPLDPSAVTLIRQWIEQGASER
ncbi:MAG: hypothetical protein U1E73_00960 [Planctomycetota bacterium]